MVCCASCISACNMYPTNSLYFVAQNSASSFTGVDVQCEKDPSIGAIRVVTNDLRDQDRPSLIEIAYVDEKVDVYADRSGLVVEANAVPAHKEGEEIVFDAETKFKDGRSGQVKGTIRCVEME